MQSFSSPACNQTNLTKFLTFFEEHFGKWKVKKPISTENGLKFENFSTKSGSRLCLLSGLSFGVDDKMFQFMIFSVFSVFSPL
jgi:hypothetical protein